MTTAARRFTSRIDRRSLLQAAALLVALAAAWPLLRESGLLNTRGGGDSPFLLQRLQQLVVALHDGHFPVRWMPDANYGFGYPFYNYYAPLSVYVAALFRFLGYSFVRALQMAQWAAFLLAAWAAFQLGWRWLRNEWAAFLASVAYTLAPFHLVNVYVRGDSLAEFWAMALYPVVLLAADNLMRRDRWRAAAPPPLRALGRPVALLALAYGALALSHNISALIFSPLLLLYLLLAGRATAAPRQAWLAAAAALALGLALSAWFWLPALAEVDLVQTAPVTAGYFHYSNHFWGVDLVQRSPLFDYDVAGRGAFRMGLLQATLALVGAVVWLIVVRRRRDQLPRVPVAFTLLALLVATLMITPLSRPLWDYLPLLSFTQFPWRFLSVQALAAALATGAITLLPWRQWLALGAAALLLAAALGDLQTDTLPVADADVTAERLAQYEWFTGNIGTTVSAEYLPATVAPRPYTSPWLHDGVRRRPLLLSGAGAVTLVEAETARRLWQVDAPNDGLQLVLPTLFWPGWQVAIDGAPAAAAPAPGSGLILIQVPPGQHEIELRLQRTVVRVVAELLSLAAFGLAAFLLLRPPPWDGSRAARGRRLAPLLFLLLPAVLLRAWPAPPYDAGTLNWDFDQRAYLHHAPDGVAFSNGARLLRYAYGADEVRAGEQFDITITWQEPPLGDTMVALLTPATHRFAAAPAVATATQSLAAGAVTFSLTLPPNTPSGLYVPRVVVADATPLLPDGQARGDLFLRPLRVRAQEDAALDGAALSVRADEAAYVGETPARAEATGLYDCARGGSSPGQLEVALAWLTPHRLSQNLVASLRLTDAGGLELAQCDLQPGYGFQPSSGWTPDQWTPDRLALPLAPTLPDTAPYALVVRLYDAQGRTFLTRRLGELTWQNGALAFGPTQPQFTLPPDRAPLDVAFDDVAALRGYNLAADGDRLALTLYWQALETARADYARFVHLLDAESGDIVAQADGMPRNESYPTGQWAEGEVVADPVALDLSGLAPGRYELAVGLYPPADPLARVPVTDAGGSRVSDDRVLLPEPVVIGE